MSMTKEDADKLIAGIERILAEAHQRGEPAQVLVARGPGPGPRFAKSDQDDGDETRWQYSCPYCKAHGDYPPLSHEKGCPYYTQSDA